MPAEKRLKASWFALALLPPVPLRGQVPSSLRSVLQLAPSLVSRSVPKTSDHPNRNCPCDFEHYSASYNKQWAPFASGNGAARSAIPHLSAASQSDHRDSRMSTSPPPHPAEEMWTPRVGGALGLGGNHEATFAQCYDAGGRQYRRPKSSRNPGRYPLEHVRDPRSPRRGKNLGDVADSVSDSLGDAAHSVGDSLGDAAHSVGETVGNAADHVGDTVGNTADHVGDAVGNAAEHVSDTVGDAADHLSESNSVGNTADHVSDTVENAADHVADSLDTGVTVTVREFKNIRWKRVGDSIEDTVDDVANSVDNGVTVIVREVTQIGSNAHSIPRVGNRSLTRGLIGLR